MYVRIQESLGQAESLSAKPATKSYKPPFTKGGEPISEQDDGKLLTILSGPSGYQDYILPIMAVQGSALPRRFLRIVSSPKAVPERLRIRFTKQSNKIVGGTIDRRTGTIYMLEAPGLRGQTRLEFALHEAVHLFAHPFIAEVDVGTFQHEYHTGFGEGVTQVITEDIMAVQGINKYYRERPYDLFTPPARRLIEIFSLDAVAKAYFWGAIKEFTAAMESRWGEFWKNVRNFTSSKNLKMALDEINKLEAAYHKRRRKRPAGDFPTLSPFVRYA